MTAFNFFQNCPSRGASPYILTLMVSGYELSFHESASLCIGSKTYRSLSTVTFWSNTNLIILFSVSLRFNLVSYFLSFLRQQRRATLNFQSFIFCMDKILDCHLFLQKISGFHLFFYNISDCHFFFCKINISDFHFFMQFNFRLLFLSSILFLHGYTILQLFISILAQSLSPGAGIEYLFFTICLMTTRIFILVKKKPLLTFLPNWKTRKQWKQILETRA